MTRTTNYLDALRAKTRIEAQYPIDKAERAGRERSRRPAPTRAQLAQFREDAEAISKNLPPNTFTFRASRQRVIQSNRNRKPKQKPTPEPVLSCPTISLKAIMRITKLPAHKVMRAIANAHVLVDQKANKLVIKKTAARAIFKIRQTPKTTHKPNKNAA